MWREFVWGGIAGAFGEGMMHPVDTLKTRLQSQAIMTGAKVGDCFNFYSCINLKTDNYSARFRYMSAFLHLFLTGSEEYIPDG